MGITKTLGGDRLGSGKKMKVELHGYERSTHDMGYLWRSTMSAGTLVPFLCEVALPGDTFDITLDCDVKTHPTLGPLFGSYKVQLDIFQAPVRLYNGDLHNNALGIGRNMSQIILPKIEMTAIKFDPANVTDLDNAQINPSALLSYLGIRGIGHVPNSGTNQTRKFNAIPILAYHEIYKNYYANKQEEIGAVLHTPSEALVNTVTAIKIRRETSETLPTGSTSAIPLLLGSVISIEFTGTQPIPSQEQITTSELGAKTADELSTGVWTLVAAGVLESPFRQTYWGNLTAESWAYQTAQNTNTGAPKVQTFDLADIDSMRKAILQATGAGEFLINSESSLEPYKWLYQIANGVPNTLSSQEGLLLKTYQSDLFNNWLKTENIDEISSITAIDTSGGSFSIDTLNLSRKVYNMLNRINVSGGSYDDWLDAVYDHEHYQRCESPIYHGGLIKELVFQEIFSAVSTENQPLGTLAGRGGLAGKHKGGKTIIKIDEPSYILGIISLTPRVDYSQGNKWDTQLNTMDDFHKPALDEIGFQELITEQMAWWDTEYNGSEWVQRSAGKQPAWINYMTNVNQVRGNFAITDNEMFMTLNRRYENDSSLSDATQIKDLTTYIDPSKFNFIFAETSLDAQNFWAQIAVDMIVRRKMSAKIMPNI